MNSTVLTVIGGIVSAAITGWVMLAVASRNATSTQRNAITAPYGELARRVTDLEKSDEEKARHLAHLRDRLEIVIRDRDALVAYVKQLGAWIAAGAKPPAPPVPTHLHDLLDVAGFELAHIVETTTTTTRIVPPPETEEP